MVKGEDYIYDNCCRGDYCYSFLEENKKALRRAVLAESYDPQDIELTSILDIVSKTEKEREFVVNQIKNIFFLKHMPKSHLFAIADGLLERQVAANENIYTQGDVGDEFYIVKKGQFDVLANGMKVGTHDDSGYFGEMALMYNVQRRNTIKAATDGLLWYVKRSNFKQILTKSEHQSRRNNVELLKKVNIFKNMTDAELEKTADALRLVHFDNEELIVKQGEKADSLMIIENGRALLTTVTETYPKGKEDFIETGAYFGELALLSEIVRSSTVTAVGDVYVLVLEADTFSRMVGNCHEIVSRAPPPIHKEKPKKARLAKEY